MVFIKMNKIKFNAVLKVWYIISNVYYVAVNVKHTILF